MPASPSFPSDGRGKWRKRKREPLISSRRQQKHEDDDDGDEEDAEDDLVEQREDDSEGPNQNQNQNLQSGTANDPAGAMETEVLDGGVRYCDFPPVLRHAVSRPHQSVLAIVALERANHCGGDTKPQGQGQGQGIPLFLENLSYGQLQALSAVPADSLALDQDRSDGGNSAYVLTPPPIMEGRGVVKRFGSRVHVVPVHSDWFSPATVHRLERQVVPHFFSGKSPDHTPEKYMECRNYVVAKYMENPEKRLTASDFLGLALGVDVEDLTRIVRFLDHWGIINYCAVVPCREPWNSSSYLREDPNGDIHVPSAAIKSIDSLIKFDKPKCKLKAADVYSSLPFHDENASDLDNRIRERLSENHCNYCSRSLHNVYYQSQKEVDILLCSDCFHEGRFIIGHSSIDFMRLDSTKDYADTDGESWTDQETLLLLEAMELYNENWNEIAEHVGTKSKAQCILHFLRLPVEDGLLENIEIPSVSMSSNLSNGDAHGRKHSNLNGDIAGSCQEDAEFESCFPFANSGNPVMAMVAFLASAVGPRVAAACAHASLAALSEDNSASTTGSIIQTEGSGHNNRMNSESMHGRDAGPHGDLANSIQHKDNSAAHGSRNQNDAGAAPLSSEKVKAAAKVGLAAAATKAKLFADHEEREIQRLSANIINHQLKRLELKLKQFAEVETFLMKECEQVERTRQRIIAERGRILSTRVGSSGGTSTVNLPGVGPSMVNNNTGNSRQQIMSASPSQPSISGYSNNQTIQPQVSPFMPRQSMFGLGPRLPLAAIQSSSSNPTNVMFNASGNTQPTHNHPMLRPVHGTSSGLG
ncbi:SWI/SNF complex subunit SWI3C isoform X2 [Ziziphus jujuba]|uniref:SWI/SNF complex subunit SWI3C isoform X2 n=1 Tax=Ziziphus jujuba TaxID=326968 RepID=A0ABM4A9G3_ZIZJJ|nr:SWI/SNF complex subunit SWI3C isoform X2 [Ziziphus jujuba]